MFLIFKFEIVCKSKFLILNFGFLIVFMTPIHETPYFAVIFTSTHHQLDEEYEGLDARLITIAEKIDGFLGMDSAGGEYGISVSYWKDEASITAWKKDIDHQAAMQKGIEKWFDYYNVRISKVERNYEFKRS
jgi:heme-degrading monooxygenase HmoA